MLISGGNMDEREQNQIVNKHAVAMFERKGGLMRMSEAIRAGVHRDTLRAMVEHGELQKLSRGLYQLAQLPQQLGS